ncbi:hypothetical protein E2C01_006870 [Portunus trituberculatus]|uniref:Uncharacterized protein n=1 Tax=Portunus trituberculatus TaxID=210409 RepID=A0A5B7CWA2_PORTR|nr:hypothetical protein [Portunus trituberculatus]
MSHLRRKISATSLNIAGPLDMRMERPPPTPGVNIHLQSPTKVDVYPVPQEGQQEPGGAAAPAATPRRGYGKGG